jgi:hypothetical protein
LEPTGCSQGFLGEFSNRLSVLDVVPTLTADLLLRCIVCKTNEYWSTILQSAIMKLPVIAAAFGRMGILRHSPRLRAESPERWTGFAVCVDEGFVELEPDALAFWRCGEDRRKSEDDAARCSATPKHAHLSHLPASNTGFPA